MAGYWCNNPGLDVRISAPAAAITTVRAGGGVGGVGAARTRLRRGTSPEFISTGCARAGSDSERDRRLGSLSFTGRGRTTLARPGVARPRLLVHNVTTKRSTQPYGLLWQFAPGIAPGARVGGDRTPARRPLRTHPATTSYAARVWRAVRHRSQTAFYDLQENTYLAFVAPAGRPGSPAQRLRPCSVRHKLNPPGEHSTVRPRAAARVIGARRPLAIQAKGE